jgi:hypothetical protein
MNFRRISPGHARPGVGPSLAMNAVRRTEHRKEFTMIAAFVLALAGLAVIKTLELVANHC